MLTYDNAPRDASGWPQSGKPGQDIIVNNPFGLEEAPETASDNQAFFYIMDRLMNEGSHVHGSPPMDSSNPQADAEPTIVGGVHIEGRAKMYNMRDGNVRVQDAGSPIEQSAATPQPPSTQQQQAPVAPASPPFLFIGLVVIALAAFLLWHRRNAKGSALEFVR